MTGFAYNAKNVLITRTEPLLRPESFTFDDNDNLLTHTDRKGQITTHGYDGLNRRTLTTWQGGATTAYTFDAGDRLTQITDSVSGTVTRTYATDSMQWQPRPSRWGGHEPAFVDLGAVSSGVFTPSSAWGQIPS